VVNHYSFGRIVVDGEEYSADVILLPDEVRGNWWRAEGHRLQAQDLNDVWAAAPEVLIVGTGASGMMGVDHSTRERLEEEGIELVLRRTREACEEYNRLARRKRVAAALHLTC
jgi:hypothetical protein